MINVVAIIYHVAGNALLSNALCFTATLCTFWKTVLYLLVNVCGGEHGFIHTRHNSTRDMVIFYIIPNAIWIIMPLAVLLYQFHSLLKKAGSRHSPSKKTH